MISIKLYDYRSNLLNRYIMSIVFCITLFYFIVEKIPLVYFVLINVVLIILYSELCFKKVGDLIYKDDKLFLNAKQRDEFLDKKKEQLIFHISYENVFLNFNHKIAFYIWFHYPFVSNAYKEYLDRIIIGKKCYYLKFTNKKDHDKYKELGMILSNNGFKINSIKIPPLYNF